VFSPAGRGKKKAADVVAEIQTALAVPPQSSFAQPDVAKDAGV